MSTDPRDAWVVSHDSLVSFASVLVQLDWLDTPQDVLDFFEKPWKYTPEYELWDGCGRPQSDDAAWIWFTQKMDKLA